MSVQLSGSVIAAIYAQGDTPDTPEEWIIAAINLGGILASGDIKADGSVAFTGQETFGAGLKTDLIEEVTGGAGITFPNDIHANSIKDNANDIAIDQTTTGKKIILQTLDAAIAITSGTAIGLETQNNGDLDLTVHGTGVVNMNGSPTHTGTVDTAGTPNLVFVNGSLMSAS